jgi:hypothetical protein
MPQILQYRLRIAFILAVLIPLGFYTKYYSGPGAIWVNQSAGGILYEIFWCLVIALIIPDVKPINVAVIVFTATSVLECLQLWHPVFLEMLRKPLIGRTLLGTTFSWLDFPHYAIGSALGGVIVKRLKKQESRNKNQEKMTADRGP